MRYFEYNDIWDIAILGVIDIDGRKYWKHKITNISFYSLTLPKFLLKKYNFQLNVMVAFFHHLSDSTSLLSIRLLYPLWLHSGEAFWRVMLNRHLELWISLWSIRKIICSGFSKKNWVLWTNLLNWGTKHFPTPTYLNNLLILILISRIEHQYFSCLDKHLSKYDPN